ncbi:MAG: TRAP transporter substrate-binding protein DctP [Verrucomicrobiae bacterium]|nr:TRAP transporter substrate-binding protein DctP [Verrucomicrobiae bacterium]
MNRRQFLRHSAVGLAATPWAVPFVARAAARPEFRLAMATVAPRGSSFHQSFQTMARQWRDASGGRVDVTLYPGTQGGEPAIVRRMGIQQLQGAMLTAAGMGLIDKAPTALQLIPMAFQSWEEVDHVRDAMRPRLEQAFTDKGYQVLFWADAGWVRWFTRRPILRPADLKPMKIFAAAGDNDAIDIMRAYYDPVPLEPDKIFTALTTGLIDGVPLPPFLANFTQVASVARHMLDLRFTPVTGALLVSRRAWERIPADLRTRLESIAEETGAEVRAQSRAEDDAAITAMRDRQGLTVHPVTPDVAAEWRQVIAEAYPRLRGRLVPAPLFDEVQRLLGTFRTASGA